MAAIPDGKALPPRKRRKKDNNRDGDASGHEKVASKASTTSLAGIKAMTQQPQAAASQPTLKQKGARSNKRVRRTEEPSDSKPADSNVERQLSATAAAGNGTSHPPPATNSSGSAPKQATKRLKVKAKKNQGGAKGQPGFSLRAGDQQHAGSAVLKPQEATAAEPKVAAQQQQQNQQQQERQQQQHQVAANVAVVAPAQTVTALPKKGGVSSNWQQLKQAVAVANAQHQQQVGAAKRRRPHNEQGKAQLGAPHSLGSSYAVTTVVAMDCEMVGVGPGGRDSVLARVAVVNSEGNILLDTFVRPVEFVTDFRTRFSGVRPSNLRDAIPHEQAVGRVRSLLEGRILVGHALHNDFRVLGIEHPPEHTRDTSRYKPLMHSSGPGLGQTSRSLKVLAQEQLGLRIQEGEHSPVEDARAALYLYLKFRKEWEKSLAKGLYKLSRQQQTAAAGGVRRAAKKEKKREKRIQQRMAAAGAGKGEEGVGEKRKREAGAGVGGGARRKKGKKGAAELAENLNVSGDPMADL